MFRRIIASLPLIALPAIAVAEATQTPVWCCPDQCISDDGSAALVPGNAASGDFDLILNGVRVPVMPGAFQGTAPDSLMRYCLGYNAFGDLQVKCLFVPPSV